MTEITERKRAEAALRKSEERFMLAARATNNIIFDWDVRTNRTWVNEAVCEHFGHSRSGEIDHELWVDAVHPDDRDRVLAEMTALFESGEQVWSGEYRFERGDGTYADVLSHVYVIREHGTAVRVIGATVDISERKKAERAVTAQILDSAAEGIVGMGLDGRATFANASATHLLGRSAEEIVGSDMHAIVHRGESSPDHAWCDCPMRAALLAAKRSASDHDVILRKDGSSFFADYTISPIVAMNGAIAGGVVTFRDISERRAVERMKDEFVSIVSHELRTPLTSIRGALGLLAGGRLGEVSPKAARMLDIAVSNTDRLVRLINDILDMERMESGQVTLNRQLCDIDDAMSQAIEAIRPMADKAGVLLECKPWPGVVLADPDRLAQTFANLLSNAIKFSPAGSTVTLSATDVPGFVEFEVADRGRGIPADKLELIFERFQQVDASDSREKGGSGLGLPICRSIVRQHGGEIRAESTPGSGSRFRFTIPRSDKPVIEAVSIGKTVVICDDEISIRSVVTALLEQRGYHAVPIGSGPELLRRIGAIAPDAVILDLLMPGLNGCETLARLKEDPRTAGIPVIIMSVFSAEDSAWPVDDLAGWIQKPIDERTIVDALERAFRLSLDASHVA